MIGTSILVDRQQCQASISQAIQRALRAFEVPEPKTLAAWADENFYLSIESSDTEGPWKTLAFQRGVMNAMSNDDVREVWCLKGARVGYTKMIMAFTQWAAEHKRRTGAIWQPNDGDRDHFVKTEVEPAIRDNPVIRSIFPSFEKKSKHNTLELKQFIGAAIHLKGGKSGKNYRRMTLQYGIADELDTFDDVIDDDGKPVALIRERVLLSAFSKVIFGSTPLVKGNSKIETGEESCAVRLRYHIDCPHCRHTQEVRWGGRDARFGIKWPDEGTHEERAEQAGYQCENCHELISDKEFRIASWDTGRWMTEDQSIYLGNDDGACYYADGSRVDPHPRSIGFKIWQGLNELIPFSKIAMKWFESQSDKTALREFLNLTLAEAWEEDGIEQLDHQVMHRTRREPYEWEVPEGVNALTLGIDVQDDRFEAGWVGFGAGEEAWNIDYRILQGDLAQPVVWDQVKRLIRETAFRKQTGEIIRPVLTVIDHGGHYSKEVERLSKSLGVLAVMPAKGLSVYGRPIVTIPRKRNANGVYLLNVGTDTVKNLVHQRLQIEDHGPGFIHWPRTDAFDEEYFKQFTAEKRIPKWTGGVKRYVWDSEKRRNEPWDVFMLNMVAINVVQQRFGLCLDEPAQVKERTEKPKRSLAEMARELNDG